MTHSEEDCRRIFSLTPIYHLLAFKKGKYNHIFLCLMHTSHSHRSESDVVCMLAATCLLVLEAPVLSSHSSSWNNTTVEEYYIRLHQCIHLPASVHIFACISASFSFSKVKSTTSFTCAKRIVISTHMTPHVQGVYRFNITQIESCRESNSITMSIYTHICNAKTWGFGQHPGWPPGAWNRALGDMWSFKKTGRLQIRDFHEFSSWFLTGFGAFHNFSAASRIHCEHWMFATSSAIAASLKVTLGIPLRSKPIASKPLIVYEKYQNVCLCLIRAYDIWCYC